MVLFNFETFSLCESLVNNGSGYIFPDDFGISLYGGKEIGDSFEKMSKTIYFSDILKRYQKHLFLLAI